MLTPSPYSSSRIRWQGRIRIEHRTLDGRLLRVVERLNLITEGGIELLVGALRGEDAEIKYVAWGLDDTAPDPSDVALGDEAGRKAVTDQQAGGGGTTMTIGYLAPNEANVAIEEIGWFAGAGATAAPGSGTLLARVAYTYNKTDLESILIMRVDVLEEVLP